MLAAPFVRAHEVAVDMVKAATRLLDSLDAGQRKQATYALTAAERENWNFVPIARQGLPIKQMSTSQHALGLALVNSLDEIQRQTAIFAPAALKEIVTTNQKRVNPLAPAGIAAAQLQPAQREKLFALVKLYLARWRPELAGEIFTRITAAGLDQVTFAWAGALDRSKATYYRIQGPTFLIEFDNFQNNANHVHSTVREFKGDFGHDLLAEHYAKEHGKR